jgi:fatty acid desaturase
MSEAAIVNDRATAGPVPVTGSASFVRQVHEQLRDLRAAKPRRYWSDLLATVLTGYAAFAVYVTTTWPSAIHVVAGVVCGLAMYRAVVFTHEITHRRGGSFAAFAFAWNLLCGVPLLMPSFLYGDHKGHHSSLAYGTWSDPEYILRSPRWRARLVVFLLLPLLYPLFACVRFLILTPAAIVSARVNRLVWRYASSLYVMNESYRREFDLAAAAPSRWAQEAACCAWGWFVVGLVVTGRLSLGVLGDVYLVVLFWLEVNQLRTLVAHRYGVGPHDRVDYVGQLLDTNSFPCGRWLPELWAPVGLRYHALHHLLPMLPYHALAAAHARLMSSLPANSPYHQTINAGWWPALAEVLRRRERDPAARRSAAAPPTAGP